MFSHDQYQALQQGAGLFDRSARGRLELTGGDRRSYLHGLLTNDILALSPGTGCYAALLTPQGRMISDLRVSEIGDRLLVDLPESTAASVRQRFADFIFTEDVEVRDAGSELRHFGIYGPKAAEVLNKSFPWLEPSTFARATADKSGESVGAGGSLPAKAGSHEIRVFTASNDRSVVVLESDDYGVAGFEIFVPTPAADRLADALRAAGAIDVDAATVEVTRVEAGRPEFGPDMDEHTIPLEAGIEDRAISQTKGCYVGQEVIVRVLHRGQGRVAKRLVGIIAGPDGPPFGRGARLEADGKPIGSITSAVSSPRLGRSIALAYVHRDFAEPGRILQAASDGDAAALHPVTVVRTPFAAPASE